MHNMREVCMTGCVWLEPWLEWVEGNPHTCALWNKNGELDPVKEAELDKWRQEDFTVASIRCRVLTICCVAHRGHRIRALYK